MIDNLKPPCAPELEIAVLGSIIYNEQVFAEVLEYLEEKTFYEESHQLIFKACLQLYNQSQPIDMLTVSNQLTKNGDLEKAGGHYYISHITSLVVTTANTKFHSVILEQKFIHRQIIQIGQDAIVNGNNESYDLFDTLQNLKRKLEKLEAKINKHSKGETTEQVVAGIIDDMENNVVEKGHSWGLKDLDAKTNGIMPGYLITVAALPGMGKTSCIKMVIRQNAIIEKKKVKVWSLEMTTKQILIDILAGVTKIPSNLIRKKNLTDEQKQQLREAAKEIKNNLQIFPSGSSTHQMIRKEIENDPCDIAIVDYIQIMKNDPEDGKNILREAQIAAITTGLAQTAKDTHTAIIELSQLNREVIKRNPPKPILSDLKDSGTIEANSVQVLFLHRPDYFGDKNPMENGISLKGLVEIIIAKSRFGDVSGGDVPTVKAKFIKEYTAFEDYEEPQQQIELLPENNEDLIF